MYSTSLCPLQIVWIFVMVSRSGGDCGQRTHNINPHVRRIHIMEFTYIFHGCFMSCKRIFHLPIYLLIYLIGVLRWTQKLYPFNNRRQDYGRRKPIKKRSITRLERDLNTTNHIGGRLLSFYCAALKGYQLGHKTETLSYSPGTASKYLSEKKLLIHVKIKTSFKINFGDFFPQAHSVYIVNIQALKTMPLRHQLHFMLQCHWPELILKVGCT